ncbi:unnamed protein product [Parascedosporium putredinis]|uniref:methylcrotonoyl-CoA carboxylase n=1 Tax=Parascedosporium putredinis TaxID=1442378 RepID=A0A9P1GY30_9PEZI|nr:unnamed protein product [Parascedosporium putredinis]CAI7989551.1 unnamed protein product [Parascedosporium putredinis]
MFRQYTTKLAPSDKVCQDNAAAWQPVLEKWEDVMQWAAGEGPSKHVERHHERGMLSAAAIVPFLELMPTAGCNIKHSSPNASVLCGVGLVHGRLVMIAGNIPTLDSGASNEISVKRASAPAKSPSRTASHDLPQPIRRRQPPPAVPRVPRRRRRLQGHHLALRRRLPTCTIVFGSSTAGGAYQPGMSSYSIFVKDQAQVFLGGPPLVYMATGEVTTAEELGGAEMHTSVSGVGDAFAGDEFEACALARNWVLSLPQAPTGGGPEPAAPILAPNAKGDALYPPVQRGLDPIIFLHNVTGFMVGTKSEQNGIIRAGSTFIDAVSRSTVPHISILCGASYGAGNYAMCGRAYSPRFLFSWPNSKCSVMGPEQLAGVMEMIAREAASKAGRAVNEAQISARTEGLKNQVERESDAYSTSGWVLDDGVIDPAIRHDYTEGGKAEKPCHART